MAALKNLEDALIHEMQDLLSAEKQITKALPKMAKKAQSSELKSAFEEHLKQTERQVDRLEKAFEHLGRSPRARKCEGLAGIIEEGEELLKEDAEPTTKDALLISAAQKVEHYEIASYGAVCTWAELLGHNEIKKLLGETLDEEKKTDEKLKKLAAQVNPQAAPA